MSDPRTIVTVPIVRNKVRQISAKTERDLAAWRASKTPEQLAALHAEWKA